VAAVAGKALLKRFKAIIHNATTMANKGFDDNAMGGEVWAGAHAAANASSVGSAAAATGSGATPLSAADEEEASSALGGLSYKEIKVRASFGSFVCFCFRAHACFSLVSSTTLPTRTQLTT